MAAFTDVFDRRGSIYSQLNSFAPLLKPYFVASPLAAELC